MLASPFVHFPISEACLDTCIGYLPSLLPLHQPALIQVIFKRLPVKRVRPVLPDLAGLLSSPHVAGLLSEYILKVCTPAVADELITNGGLVSLSGLISEMGPEVPASAVLLMVKLILSAENVKEVLVEQSKEILNSVFAIDGAAESALIIAAHFARTSAAFIPVLIGCGSLNIGERALLSEIPRIRGRALDFFGNYTKWSPLPDEIVESIIDLLIGEIEDEDLDCSKLSCFALSNCIFRDPKLSSYVLSKLNIQAALKLLQSKDTKQIENIAAVFGNLVRKSDENVQILIENGVLDGIVNRMKQGGEIGGRLCLHLSTFCQWEEARRYLKRIGAAEAVSGFCESKDERVKRIASSVMNSILV
jgi:hypothetical protein